VLNTCSTSAIGHQQTSIGIPSVHCQTAAQGVARQLFSAMGIERDNKDKRQDWVLRGLRQFDAPVCVIITYDRVPTDGWHHGNGG
jgi:hypothetical protein